jgi:uroporphyrinogen III methyltransferase/synthase
LTVRAAAVLATADVVIHDRLSSAGLLELAPPSARRVDVGKSPGSPIDQEEINRMLVDLGREGRSVVRLKGGDPFVFGRGGEEALALLEAGVPFEVVPGITSAVAVPAYAGVPVTHRGVATSFTVVTGHSRHAVDRETNWEALAQAGGTIVVLMGVAHRDVIASRLIAGGLPGDTPVAAVRWGTRPDQSSVRVRLSALGETPLEPPVTMVIGPVAGLDLSWFESRPLFGRRVVVTRARAQASGLVKRLAELGATPIEVPTIEIEPAPASILDPAIGRLSEYAWVVFTSANAVSAVLDRVPDARALASVRIAAVGPGTAAALASYRLVPDLMPASELAAALVPAFPGPPSGKVLFPRAESGRDELVDGLRHLGWEVDVVPAYRTVPVPVPDALKAAAASADAVCFTSSSTVTSFVSALGVGSVPRVVVCIGPVTAETALSLGLAVTAVASTHTIDGLVSTLMEVLAA